jgi:hypothetical protein
MALTRGSSDAWNRLAHIETEPDIRRLVADLHGASGA